MSQSLYFFTLGVLLVLSASHLQLSDSRKIPPETQKAIDDYVLNTFFGRNQTYGLGLAVVQNGGNGEEEILYTTGYGLADIPKNIPITNSTQFLMGSVTKVWTASYNLIQIIYYCFFD